MVEEVIVFDMTEQEISSARSLGLIVKTNIGEDGAVSLSGLQWTVEAFLLDNNLKGN